MLKSSKEVRHYNVIILGAGPAGLQLAHDLRSSGENYLVIEEGASAGTFFKTFPRHRKLISVNKVNTGSEVAEYNLRFDWNSLLNDELHLLGDYTKRYFPAADDFVNYLSDFAAKFELNVEYNCRIVRISRDGMFELASEAGERFTCDRLVIATGLAKEKSLDFPGAEHVEMYGDVSIAPEEFENARVMVIGKGNSAFETADNLVESAAAIHMLSPNSIKLAWNTHYVGHLRAVNNNFLDTYQLKSQNTILDATIEKIEKVGHEFDVTFLYTHANGQRLTLRVDRIISCAGFKFDDSIFAPSCRPKLCSMGKYPEQTSAWESVNQPSMYFAGTLMHMRDYRKTFSGFVHGFRYNVRALARILNARYHDRVWPSAALPFDAREVERLMMTRIHESSTLFQQPGFIFDIFRFDQDADLVTHLRDMPLEYFQEERLNLGRAYIAVSMEYGTEKHVDMFNIERHPDRGDLSAFIHPVIRIFDRHHKLVARHDIPEDLLNVWQEPMYLTPLRAFLAESFRSLRSVTPASDVPN